MADLDVLGELKFIRQNGYLSMLASSNLAFASLFAGEFRGGAVVAEWNAIYENRKGRPIAIFIRANFRTGTGVSFARAPTSDQLIGICSDLSVPLAANPLGPLIVPDGGLIYAMDDFLLSGEDGVVTTADDSFFVFEIDPIGAGLLPVEAW